MIQNVISVSETGLCRHDNQDAVLVVHTDDVGLFVVADGMGGHHRGELASQTAVELMRSWWKEVECCVLFMPFTDIVSELEKKIKEINEYILQMYKELGQCGGTTLCLLFICHNAYAVMSIGDSRIYRAQGRNCAQITTDDVWENQPYIRQSMSESEIRKNTSYGKLTQAIGVNVNIKISVRTGSIEKRTCFLLCSDGIYKYCKNSWFISHIRKVKNKKRMNSFVNKIRKAVYKNGAKDNLSMIIILMDKNENKLNCKNN